MVRRIIGEVLPSFLLREYMFKGDKKSGEESIIRNWELMLGKLSAEASKLGSVPKEIYGMMRVVKAHSAKCHAKRGELCEGLKATAAITAPNWQR